MKKIIVLAFILSLFINTSASAGNITLDFSEAKPVNASVRSALMPGWGQGWNSQPVKGWVTFGVFAASVVGALYFNANADHKYEKYTDSGYFKTDYYDDYKDNRTVSQVLTYVAVGTWIYSVIDAYFICKQQISDGTRPSAFNFRYEPQNDGYYVTYSKRFDI